MAERRTTPEGWWIPPTEDDDIVDTGRTDALTAHSGVDNIAINGSVAEPAASAGSASANTADGIGVEFEPDPSVLISDEPPLITAWAAVTSGPTTESPRVGLPLNWFAAAHEQSGLAKQWPGLATWTATQSGTHSSSQPPGQSATPALPVTSVTASPTMPGNVPVCGPNRAVNRAVNQPQPQLVHDLRNETQHPFASRATTVLVLSILGAVLSVTCVGGLFAPVAWIMGNGVRKDARSTGWPEPRKNKAGRIVAMCGTVLGVLAVLVLAAYAVSNASSTT